MYAKKMINFNKQKAIVLSTGRNYDNNPTTPITNNNY